MNNNQKYIYYKNKYLILKKKINQVGGEIYPIGAEVKTISNSGMLENMSNQCFFISILHYLINNGHRLTLKQLRTEAGLGSDTEHVMVDNIENPEIMENINQIINMYNLRIYVYDVTQGVIINYLDDLSPDPPHATPPNEVHIANFSQGHFELIDRAHGHRFEPKLEVNGEYKKQSEFQLPEYLTAAYNQANPEIAKLLGKIKDNQKERIAKIKLIPSNISGVDRNARTKALELKLEEMNRPLKEKIVKIRKALKELENEFKGELEEKDSTKKLLASTLFKPVASVTTEQSTGYLPQFTSYVSSFFSMFRNSEKSKPNPKNTEPHQITDRASYDQSRKSYTPLSRGQLMSSDAQIKAMDKILEELKKK
jgi:hypothetical protein